ncbi:MAG: hypothetical protein WCW13_01665 [archaeon]|jgi:hypothetical protein
MQKKFLVLLLLLILSICSTALAISPDEAITIVSVKNNFLMPNETTSVIKEMIKYQGKEYVVVATKSGTSITAYIPLKNSDGNIASLDLEIREIIKTSIIYTEITQLKDTTTPASWPLSYSTKNFFYDLSTDFTGLMNDAISVQTILNAIGTSEAKTLASKADAVQAKAELLSKQSKEVSTQVEEGMKLENSYLAAPDTNLSIKYETAYKNYFSSISQYKLDFVELTNEISQLNSEISILDPSKLTVEQQRSYQILLTKAPLAISKASRTNPAKIDSFLGTNDQMRTLIEKVFANSKSSDGYATTLATRKTRNEAWKAMYGTNDTLIKLNKSFETLEKAATAILSEENVTTWAAKDSVDALTANWSAAKIRYNNSEYEKAKSYALNAQKNVQQIIQEGQTSTTDTTSQDLLIKIIAGLVILVIAVFVFEKFIMKKKTTPEEDYEKP